MENKTSLKKATHDILKKPQDSIGALILQIEEKKKIEEPFRKEREELLSEITIQQVKEKSAKFLKKVERTLNYARQSGIQQLSPEFLEILDKKLQTLFWNRENFEISVKAFDRLCTEKRLECMREMYREMSGREFHQKLKKFKIKDIYMSMGFPDPEKTGGYYREDPIFFAECCPLIEKAAKTAAQKYGLQGSEKEIALLAEKIFWRESKGDPLAASRSGKHFGFAQLESVLYNGKDFNYPQKINPFNPEEAIPRGVDYIASHFKSFGGNEEETKQAYNAGRRAVLNSNKKPLSPEAQEYSQNVDDDHARLLALLESNPEDL